MLKVAIMLCSPPKYLFSIEIEISAIVIVVQKYCVNLSLLFHHQTQPNPTEMKLKYKAAWKMKLPGFLSNRGL